MTNKMQSDAKQTAKHLLAIESATVKSSINACEIGVKQTAKKFVSKLVNIAIENWLTLRLKKRLQYAPQKQQKRSVTKIDARTKCLPRMAATFVLAAAKLNAYFCRLITYTMTAMWNASPVRMAAAAPRFIFGCASASSLRGIKCCV